MEVIKRGSVYLTDDYTQSMISQKSANSGISSFALLNLPEWSELGMSITPADVGLSMGISDPNILMPAAFLQYWYNCMAYARQHHAKLNQGVVIEDFAEQSFWKMLLRLSNTELLNNDIRHGNLIVYKSDDLIVNQTSIDGNAYLEILLSVSIDTKKQQFQMIPGKPAYLESVNNLPINNVSMILGGNELALYDKNKTYYDLQSENVLRSSYVKDIEDTKLQYNAILLYYTVKSADTEIEQLAGIYFPDKWKQVDDVYQLEAITKESDTSRGYSINIKFSQSGNYTYEAANSTLSSAMQFYNDAYRKQLRLNAHLESLQETVSDQLSRMISLESMLSSTKIGSIEAKLQTLSKRITSNLGGTVSANQLLELFLKAKDNQGLLQLELFMADMSKSITDKEIVVTNPISSAYRDMDVIPAGTSITEVLSKLLSNKVPPIYDQPLVHFRTEGYERKLVPYGTDIDLTLELTIVDGDSGGHEVRRLFKQINGVTSSIEIANTVPETEVFLGSVKSPVKISVEVFFNEGPLKDYSDGTPCYAGHVYAGIKSASIMIIPEFELYLGGMNFIEQFSEIALDDLEIFGSANSPKSYVSGDRYQIIASPIGIEPLVSEQPIATKASEDYMFYAYDSLRIRINSEQYELEL